MTEKEKFLLIKDLCARLPYNLVINCTEEDDEKTNFDCFLAPDMIKDIKSETSYWIIKPYLRPLSSMTKEERKEFLTLLLDKHSYLFYIDDNGVINGKSTDIFGEGINSVLFSSENVSQYIDWLNKKGFDYRGLIPMGLALEASDDMYR